MLKLTDILPLDTQSISKARYMIFGRNGYPTKKGYPSLQLHGNTYISKCTYKKKSRNRKKGKAEKKDRSAKIYFFFFLISDQIENILKRLDIWCILDKITKKNNFLLILAFGTIHMDMKH